MKTVLTLFTILIFGITAMAQDNDLEKVEVNTLGVELDIKVENNQVNKIKVARLYRYKNSRIKKELAFRTKRNRSKLA